MPDDLTPVVDPESICQGRAWDVDGGERSARQKETMLTGTITELSNDVPFVVQPIRFGIRGSWDNVDGRKLALREKEAMSPGRHEQPHDLTPAVDVTRDRRGHIGNVDGLKS